MLALDRGGQCSGVADRLSGDALKANLDRLIRREMSMVPTAFPARWIELRTALGPLLALTFAMDRRSARYITGLDDGAIADVLATACGFRGSMAEYLFSTVAHLEELGIHDRHLWRLQALVADASSVLTTFRPRPAMSAATPQSLTFIRPRPTSFS
jgi:cation transport protein ChaC